MKSIAFISGISPELVNWGTEDELSSSFLPLLFYSFSDLLDVLRGACLSTR